MKGLGSADPAHIGPFRCVALLGQGGMGRVLLGVGPDGRLVAVKQVHADLAEDDGFRARFRREVAASRQVSGAFTAPVVDADPDAETPWLASLFVPGPSLGEAGPLPEEAVRRLAAGLAHALADVHRAGLIHRDLKPSNVLLAEDGVRVIDFGIVRAAGDQTRITHAGALIGSPAFMSPEQALGRELTPASDVFSLGATLVAACTGNPPFTSGSVPGLLYEITHGEPDLDGVPAGLRPVVGACLAKDPADRPALSELLALIGPVPPAARPWPEAVRQLLAGQRDETARLVAGSTAPAPAPHRARRRWLRPLLAVVLVAAVAATGFTVGRPYVVQAYRDLVPEPVPTPGTTPLSQVGDAYRTPPGCSEVTVRVPSAFASTGGHGPERNSGALATTCVWNTRTGDEIRADWRFFSTGTGEGTGAEQAKRYHEVSHQPGRTRRDLGLGFAEEGLWRPPDDDQDPSCTLHVRDVNMTSSVSVTGPRYPPGGCEAVVREAAESIVDAMGGR
ncbi:serine/threonine-protein kinase [Streptomyces sp. LARHCF249]